MLYTERKFLVFCTTLAMLLCQWTTFAQKSEIYTEEYATFKVALDLYDKEQYSAAQDKFNTVIKQIQNKQDEVRINSEYYAALCALELFHKDAEHLLNRFAFDHPDHPKGKKIHFQLGRYYYRSKNYNKTIDYFEKVDLFDLEASEKRELQFKLGYSYFHKDDFANAKVQFNQVIQTDNEYYVPAQYYYSHIAYTEKNYQTALEGFEKIADNEMFAAVVPYYITQIYYLQGRYEKLLEYAPKYYESISEKRKGEFAKLIGDAHYNLKHFKEAIPYLLEYRKTAPGNREDYYQLGYAYHHSGSFEEAIKFLSKATSKKDEMSQSAFHHIGDSYLKLNEKDNAKKAFRSASELNFDEDVRKNSLYNYAKLAFELSNNPYDEAIDAFQTYINDYPNDPKVDEAYEFLLKVYMTTKNYDEAIRSLEKIKVKDDRMKMAYQSITYNLAVEEFHNKNFNKAIESFKKSQLYPVKKELSAESYYWIAESQYNLKNYDAAISNYVEFKLEPGAALSEEFYNADYGIAYGYFMKSSPFDILTNWENNTTVQNQHNDLLNKSVTAFRNFIVLKDRIEPEKLLDAYLRIGDCYYLLKKDLDAIEYYNLAISVGTGDMSYAYYQKSRSQSALQDHAGKAKTLEELAQKFPNSTYNTNSMLDLASTYMQMNENAKAISTYKDFVQKYPQNANVARAYADIAFIYIRLKDYNNAEKYALKVLDNYPNDKQEVDKALASMKGVYEGRNDLPGYYDWLASRGIQVQPSEKDSALWEPVRDAFDDGNCTALLTHAATYMNQMPQGKNIIAAHFYSAQCSYQSNKEKALEHYNVVISKGVTQYYEEALQYASFLAFDKQDYAQSVGHYSKLEQVATKEENIRNSKIAQMHCYKALGNNEKLLEYSNKVLALGGLDDVLKVQATLNKGLAQKDLLMYTDALVTLSNCSKMTQSIAGAESKFNYAEIQFIQADHSGCEKTVMELVKQKPSYDYWIAKGIILLGKNYMALEDYFNAKHSLQSIVDHYDGKDKAEMVKTAQDLLDEIANIESGANSKSMIVPDDSIEFNDVDEKDKNLFEEKEPNNE